MALYNKKADYEPLLRALLHPEEAKKVKRLKPSLAGTTLQSPKLQQVNLSAERISDKKDTSLPTAGALAPVPSSRAVTSLNGTSAD